MQLHTDELREALDGLDFRAVVGFSCMRSWSSALYSSNLITEAFDGGVGWGTGMQQVSLIALVASFIVAPLALRRDAGNGHRRPIAVSLALAELGAAIVILPQLLAWNMPAAVNVGAVICGMATAVQVILWCRALGDRSTPAIAATVVGVCLFAPILALAVRSCSGTGTMLLLALYPAVSSICLASSGIGGVTWPHGGETCDPGRHPTRGQVALYCMFFLMFGTILGTIRGLLMVGNTDPSGPVATSVAISAVAAAVLLLFGTMRARRLVTALYIAIAGFVLVAEASAFIPALSSLRFTGNLVLAAGYILVFSIVTSVSTLDEKMWARAIGWSLASNYLGYALGEFVLRFVTTQPGVGEAERVALPLFFTLFLIVVAQYIAQHLPGLDVLACRPRRPAVSNEEGSPCGDGEKDRPYDRGVKAVSAQYSLTEREATLLWYLGKGYSSKAIQDKLCISASTVSTHSGNIYRKLGVHGKEDAARVIRSAWKGQGGEEER